MTPIIGAIAFRVHAGAFQAQDKGAAMFDRQEGMWVGRGKIYFDCTEGGRRTWGRSGSMIPAVKRLRMLIYQLRQCAEPPQTFG